MSYLINDSTDEWWAISCFGYREKNPITNTQHDSWMLLWEEQQRVQPIVGTKELRTTATFDGIIEFPYELLWNEPDPRTIPGCLEHIEGTLGVTVKELAQILRVSRPMVYHWRAGMEPMPENRARIEAVARLADDWLHFDQRPIGQRIHNIQAEGGSLLDILANDALDIPAVRMIMARLARSPMHSPKELHTRKSVLKNIIEDESPTTRTDIFQERKHAGKPTYVGDANNPGKLIEISPDGSFRTGRMLNRKFVPDDKNE